ncbi:hypothetical protein THIOSC15_1500004 [uncultured Thiomicrorhabdus sp.]
MQHSKKRSEFLRELAPFFYVKRSRVGCKPMKIDTAPYAAGIILITIDFGWTYQ